jgi:hypothetical protein
MRFTVEHSVELSQGQARFAREHHAHEALVSLGGGGEVFLYYTNPWADYRWLVDTDGQAVETTMFRTEPANSCGSEHEIPL